MNKTKKSLALILILLLATIISLAACNLSGITEVLRTDISLCDVTFTEDAYEYTGREIRPDLSINYVNKILEFDVDYTVEYSDNIEIGKGLATIHGIGNFKGRTSKEFDIVEKVERNDNEIPSGSIPSGEISSGDQKPSDEKKYITYTFSAQGAELVSGKLVQTVESGSIDEIVAPVVAKVGYEFLYWTYDDEEVDFDDIDSLPNQTSTFIAKFSAITYTIEYVLNGGVNDPLNASEYTVESIFPLQDATRFDKKFVGWYLDDKFNDKLTTLEGFARNLILYAKFVDFDSEKTLSYVLPDGVEGEYPQEAIYPGTTLTRPAQVLSADGSQKLVWYIDEDMTIRHNLRYMPDEDLTLYARFEDKVYAGFLDRGWYNIDNIKSIDSFEDLVAYVEFIYYYNITESKTKKITYVSGRENIMAEISNALTENTFPKMIGTTYRAEESACSVWMSSSVKDQATLAASSKDEFYPQIGSVFSNYKSNRRANFDDFAINYVEDEYECSTSDQLFYVLSHGFRPLTVSGSQAYRTYNKFKDIMRSICDDRMTDVQKARAIFDWLIVNVYYDNNVAYPKVPLPQASYKYEAFYLEGVLNGAAVCDGLSKAYAVMCAIEGIDCVRVTGKLKDAKEGDAGHAWNKVQLMGKWFLSDATWGNMTVAVQDEGVISHYEYVNGKYFLFTDEIRSEVDNYNSDQYSRYVADEQFNYYDNFEMQLEITTKNLWGVITSTKDYSFDLYIDGDKAQGYSAVDEMSYLFEYIDKGRYELEGNAFCIMLGEDMSTDKIREALSAYISRVGGRDKAKITSYSLIGDPKDIVDIANKVYKQGAIITIVISLPSTSSSLTGQNAA